MSAQSWQEPPALLSHLLCAHTIPETWPLSGCSVSPAQDMVTSHCPRIAVDQDTHTWDFPQKRLGALRLPVCALGTSLPGGSWGYQAGFVPSGVTARVTVGGCGCRFLCLWGCVGSISL